MIVVMTGFAVTDSRFGESRVRIRRGRVMLVLSFVLVINVRLFSAMCRISGCHDRKLMNIVFFQGTSYSVTDVMITECDNGSLCCGEPEIGKPCCQQGKGVWLM
jgi:hypothetical protein